MVDHLGRQDPKIRPGFFLCRQNGSVLTVQEVAAQEHYCCIKCKPLRGIPCLHQAECLKLRHDLQQDRAGLANNVSIRARHSEGGVTVEQAFYCLPTGDQTFRKGEDDHGQEKW